MKNKFNIGDRVEKTAGDYKGKCGRVIGLEFGDVAVEFDEYIKAHDCGGLGKYGHCWWCKPESIKLLQPARVIFNGNATVLIKDGKKYVSKCKDGDACDKEKGLLLCLAQANGISYRDLQGMIAGAKDCNAEKAKELAGKIATGFVEAVKAFQKSFNGEKADDKAQVREVKRKAKVGEYIKIVSANNNEPYKEGDIFKAKETTHRGVRTFLPDGKMIGNTGSEYYYIWDEEYVVLENYKPYKITLSEFWANEGKKVMAIHCKTEDEAKELLKAFNGIGKRWRGGGSYASGDTRYSVYKEKTVYDNTHGYCDVGGIFCTKKNAQIFEFNEVDLSK